MKNYKAFTLVFFFFYFFFTTMCYAQVNNSNNGDNIIYCAKNLINRKLKNKNIYFSSNKWSRRWDRINKFSIHPRSKQDVKVEENKGDKNSPPIGKRFNYNESILRKILQRRSKPFIVLPEVSTYSANLDEINLESLRSAFTNNWKFTSRAVI